MHLVLAVAASSCLATAAAYEPKWPRFSWDTVRTRGMPHARDAARDAAAPPEHLSPRP